MIAARRTRGASVIADARVRADRAVDRIVGAQWPSTRWQRDPVGFAHTILGVELWDFQVRMLEAIRDYRHVAVSGGRKIGKDYVVAVASLWWYASWPRAKVILLGPTSKQIDGIAYLEIRMLMAHTGRCVACRKADPRGPTPCPHSAVLTGHVGGLARTGIRSDDFRSIVGLTAIAGGGLRGFSGDKILAFSDEASDIKDAFYTSMLGNLASGDCHDVIALNPTKPYGFFYRAFHEERHLYFPIQQSTEENPNVVQDREVYQGLAGREWLAERERAWGRGSALWSTDVLGQFPKSAEGQLFPLEVVKAAASLERRAAASRAGRLQIGIDVAGAGQDGDETAFVARRADVALELYRQRAITPDGILAKLHELLEKYREAEDWEEGHEPLVVVDRDGSVGARVYDVVSAYRHRNAQTESEFRLIGFQGGAPPFGRMKETYKMNRDLLFAGLIEWIKDGGSIPDDLKLEGELVALRWAAVEGGKSMLEHKSKMRERLGRSPDSADGLALSVWRPEGLHRPSSAESASVPAPSPQGLDANAWGYASAGQQESADGDANRWGFE